MTILSHKYRKQKWLRIWVKKYRSQFADFSTLKRPPVQYRDLNYERIILLLKLLPNSLNSVIIPTVWSPEPTTVHAQCAAEITKSLLNATPKMYQFWSTGLFLEPCGIHAPSRWCAVSIQMKWKLFFLKKSVISEKKNRLWRLNFLCLTCILQPHIMSRKEETSLKKKR